MSNGKFDRGRFTTIPETKNIKLPIGGKIRLGVKKTNNNGVSYPVETDYFVCPKAVRDVFGDEPTELTVFFPVADTEKVFPQAYEKYGGNEALLCWGNGQGEGQRLNLENGKWEDVKCPCEHFAPYDKKTKIGGCDKRGHLKFMIPSVSIGTFYEMGVSGTVSIEEINSALYLANTTTAGCWAMIPFRMKRVPKKLKIPGTANMKTHWVVTLEIAASTEEIRRVINGEILYLGQKKGKGYELEVTEPSRGKKEVALITEDTEAEIKAREKKVAEDMAAAKKEYEESVARTAQLKEMVEKGEHEIKSYREAKLITHEETNNGLATQQQKETIYGVVICEKCGTKVYGYKCQGCKNTDLHIVKEGIYHSPLLTKADFEKELAPSKYPLKLTSLEAIKIKIWWLGDEKSSGTGEKAKREKTPPIVEATKEERMAIARNIASGKLEIKDNNAPYPDEEEPKEKIHKRSKAEDFISK